MDIETLKGLGLDLSRIEDLVVERIAESILTEDEGRQDSDFAVRVHARVEEKLNQAVDSVAGRNVIPNMEQYIENYCLQATNEWGEKKGEPLSFVQYLVQRAEHYMQEPVDAHGKTKAEEGYGWRKKQTRVVWLINHHLQYSISQALKDALKVIDETISGGLEKAIKAQMIELQGKLKVAFDGRR